MKKEKRNEFLPDEGIEDFSDLDTLASLDDEGNEIKKKKRGKLLVIPIAIAAVAGLIFLGANSQNQTPVQEDKSISLDMVNKEQVNYATKLCTLTPQWSKSMVEMPNNKQAVSPLKAREQMVNVLEKNASIINKESKQLSEIPSEVYTQTKEQKKDILVTDNILQLSEKPDEKVSTSAQSLSTTLSGYAVTLRAMSSDLKKVAKYNNPGLRAAIENVNGTFGQMNEQLQKDISSSINDDIFDNISTMKEVSEIEECNGAFIDSEELKREKGDLLNEQQKISDFAVVSRCQQFLGNVASIPEQQRDEKLKENISSCNDFISSVTIDKNDPIYKSNINFNDDKREKPQSESGSNLDNSTYQSDKSKTSESTTKSK